MAIAIPIIIAAGILAAGCGARSELPIDNKNANAGGAGGSDGGSGGNGGSSGDGGVAGVGGGTNTLPFTCEASPAQLVTRNENLEAANGDCNTAQVNQDHFLVGCKKGVTNLDSNSAGALYRQAYLFTPASPKPKLFTSTNTNPIEHDVRVESLPSDTSAVLGVSHTNLDGTESSSEFNTVQSNPVNDKMSVLFSDNGASLRAGEFQSVQTSDGHYKAIFRGVSGPSTFQNDLYLASFQEGQEGLAYEKIFPITPGEDLYPNMSPDGRYIAFWSSKNLPGYENKNPDDYYCYRYDTQTQELIRISENPSQLNSDVTASPSVDPQGHVVYFTPDWALRFYDPASQTSLDLSSPDFSAWSSKMNEDGSLIVIGGTLKTSESSLFYLKVQDLPQINWVAIPDTKGADLQDVKGNSDQTIIAWANQDANDHTQIYQTRINCH